MTSPYYYILAHILYISLLLIYDCQCNTVQISSNCIGLSDGYYYFKLMDDEKYPIIYPKCSNEYLIINPSLDEDVKSYFNSFEMFHIAVAGPSNEHAINWNEWFLSSSDEKKNNHKFVISPDCNSCDINHERQLYEEETVYMMTGSMFGCYWNYKNNHAYDQDFSTYECYYDNHENEIEIFKDLDIEQMVGDVSKQSLTDSSSKNDWNHSGMCAFNVRSANMEMPLISHESCTSNVENGYHLKPSIGTNGKHCVCAKPIITDNNKHTIKAKELSRKQHKMLKREQMEQQISEDDDVDEMMIYYLNSNDFELGTYRITKPGRYILTEDVYFNPNTDDTNEENDDLYFAAITIETNDVIIDLNDHILAMDEIFYYQQRWFTLISLSSQYYLPGQGNAFFGGANPKFASNVVIKDGTLGLTSHHCIHGNFNSNVLIEHIICRDFETHGIQLNGFDDVTIRNVEIGPSSTKQFFRGEYGFARALLPRLKQVSDENPNDKIRFDQRENEVTMNDLIIELERQMDAIFDFVTTGHEPIFSPHSLSEEKDWNDIKALFYNPSGLPNGASLYGIFLNTNGESTMSYNLNTESFSNNVRLENVKIHDLRHNMVEYTRVSIQNNNPFGSVFVNPLSGTFDAKQMFFSLERVDLLYRPRYKGSIMTDVLFALSEFSDDWNVLQSQLIFKDLTLPWSKGEDIYALDDQLVIGCNNDAMMQSGKGLMGIRMDGVRDAYLSDIEIFNLFQETPLGSTDCGEYTSFDADALPFGGGHMSQEAPMQIGFSGNMLQGISMNAADNVKLDNVHIYTLQSYTGDAIGISVWPSVNLGINGPIVIDDINAGWLIPDQVDELKWNSRPNRAPMACGLLWNKEFYSGANALTYVSNVKKEYDDIQVDVSNVYGFVYCDGMGIDAKTMFGEYIASENEQEKEIGNFDEDDDVDGGDMERFHPKMDGHHILIGSIIAVSILFCGFLTMGYIAYIYFQHKKKHTEMNDRQQLLIQQAHEEMNDQMINVQLQTAESDTSRQTRNAEEEEEEEEPNEYTPLINSVPAFNRMNL